MSPVAGRKRSSKKQRESGRGVPVPIHLPEEIVLRLECLREQTGKDSVVVVIEEAMEIYARLRNEQEIETFRKLTPRLQEVLRLMADGLSSKEIAGRLNISRKTVEFHRSRLAKTLGIRATAYLVRYAIRVGAILP